jgi:hypothetical protein
MGAKVTNNGENAYFKKSHPDKLENGTYSCSKLEENRTAIFLADIFILNLNV